MLHWRQGRQVRGRGTPLPAVMVGEEGITELGTVGLISFGVRKSASDLKSTADLNNIA